MKRGGEEERRLARGCDRPSCVAGAGGVADSHDDGWLWMEDRGERRNGEFSLKRLI